MTGLPDNDAPTPAEHLRRIANLSESVLSLLPLVGDALPQRERLTIGANAQWAMMICESAAAEWGRRQAMEMGRVLPL
jgi:hypothetical protein